MLPKGAHHASMNVTSLFRADAFASAAVLDASASSAATSCANDAQWLMGESRPPRDSCQLARSPLTFDSTVANESFANASASPSSSTFPCQHHGSRSVHQHALSSRLLWSRTCASAKECESCVLTLAVSVSWSFTAFSSWKRVRGSIRHSPR